MIMTKLNAMIRRTWSTNERECDT